MAFYAAGRQERDFEYVSKRRSVRCSSSYFLSASSTIHQERQLYRINDFELRRCSFFLWSSIRTPNY